MTNNDQKVPGYITKHKKLYNHAKKLTDTINHTHSQAYLKAVDKHLLGEDGEIDFKRLDDTKVQEEFSKTMTDLYISKAKQHFKVSKDLDELEKDLLLRSYTGASSSDIKNLVSQYGKNFTHQQFDNLKAEITNNVSQSLYQSAGGHITNEHKKGILKHTGLEGKIDSDKITKEEAQTLLRIFHEHGAISDTALRSAISNYNIKKKKK